MAFCKSCGQDIGTSSFCPKCGANQSAAAAPAAPAAPAAAFPTEGIEENVAGLLCYIAGWVSGLIFLLIDKRPFVRFHAAQAIGYNIAVVVVYFAVAFSFMMLHFLHLGFLGFALYPLLGILIFGLWILLMYKAYHHEKYMLPVVGNIAEGLAGK
ncbi:MAG TPA: DUF4870 domain-containing protein [Candidatus Acidoferrum sp.]|nr:DUF4870 domain-containing protein [Candidatus Acidoferrum sp.]